MNSQQLHIAITNATDAHARALLEHIKPLFEEVCELERTFVERINASKAARGEQAPKLRKAKREEVASYAKDAEEGEEELTRLFSTLPTESIVFALCSGLETDINFWSTHGLKHTHPADRSIVEESLQAKRRLRESFEEFLRRYPTR